MAILVSTRPAFAQLSPERTTIQIRVGGFVATPLVTDLVSTAAVDDSLTGRRSDKVTARQKPGPIGTLALRLPMRGATHLEVNASVARSSVEGDDTFTTWDIANATVGNLVLGVGYAHRQRVGVHVGVGITKLFVEKRGLFAEGNSLHPLIEGGVATSVNVGGRPLEVGLRVQAHNFATTTLRNDGATSGTVARAVLQVGTNIWQAGR